MLFHTPRLHKEILNSEKSLYESPPLKKIRWELYIWADWCNSAKSQPTSARFVWSQWLSYKKSIYTNNYSHVDIKKYHLVYKWKKCCNVTTAWIKYSNVFSERKMLKHIKIYRMTIFILSHKSISCHSASPTLALPPFPDYVINVSSSLSNSYAGFLPPKPHRSFGPSETLPDDWDESSLVASSFSSNRNRNSLQKLDMGCGARWQNLTNQILNSTTFVDSEREQISSFCKRQTRCQTQ